MVASFVGSPETVVEGALNAAVIVQRSVDMRFHKGKFYFQFYKGKFYFKFLDHHRNYQEYSNLRVSVFLFTKSEKEASSSADSPCRVKVCKYFAILLYL